MPIRLNGLATGLDTDALVKGMMQPYVMRVDKMKQNVQTVKWQQEAYRNVINGVNDISKKYFDVLKGDNYLLSSKLFSSLKPTGIPDASRIKVTTGTNAVAGNYTVKVDSLAKKAEVKGDKAVNIKSLTLGEYGVKIDDSNNKITIDSTDIELSKKGYKNLSEVASEINSKINETAILKDNVKAVVKDGEINIEKLFKVDGTNKELKVNVEGTDYTTELNEGNFTLEELTNIINNKLKTAKDASGIVLPSDKEVKVKLSLDETGIEFENAISNKNYSVTEVNLIGSENGDGLLGTDVSITGKTITYKNDIVEGYNDTFYVKIGTSDAIKITLDPGEVDGTNPLEERLNDALKKALEAKNIDTGTLVATKNEDGKIVLSSNTKEQVIITGGLNSSMSLLGLPERYEMSMSSSEKMSTIVGNEAKFTINGVEFNYNFAGDDKDKTISQILSDISNKAKVDFTYSEINKTFTLRSKGEGESSEIKGSDDTGDFLKTLFGKASFDVKGQEAQVTLTTPNGTSTVTKPGNSFTVDGVNYDITGAKENEEINFALTGNSDDSFNKIKEFIDDYNKLVDDLQKKLLEKKYRDFQPLTDEQKKDMNEEEIKKWEEKSKSGILKSDPNIQNMLFSLRRAFFDTVEGAGISLKEIGLTTSADYNEGGKIVFDISVDKDGNNGEARLKKLLKEEPDRVYKIFSQQSTSYSTYSSDLTLEQRKTRDREQGILQRVNDIFKDYTRTTKDNNGRRGIFVEKAGVQGTSSEIDSSLYKDLEKREKVIKDMERKLAERENKYYLQFAQLEKYMNQMNAQSAWLAQQLGGGTQG